VKVGIYNRWVDTLGGGEQTLGSFARVLAQDHEVEIITHEAPRWEEFLDTLGLDLREIRCAVVPFDRDHYRQVQARTRGYDLFVNCSYLDHVRAYARLNVMQVFFPPEPPDPGHRALAPPARAGLPPFLRPLGGLHPLERDRFGPFAWTDGDGRFELDTAGSGGPVEVRLTLASGRGRHHGPVPIELSLDGQPLGSAALPADGFAELVLTIDAPPGRSFLDLASPTFEPAESGEAPHRRVGVRIARAAASAAQESSRDVAVRRVRPPRDGAGLGHWSDRWRFEDAIASYHLLLANSHFTQRWIGRRYGRSSELLYPPVQIGQFETLPKRPHIISVGRFFVEGHSKKQLEMISLFRRLCDEGLAGWTYHVVGGTHGGAEAQRYLDQCRDLARGYPVVLYPDAPLRELVRLYGEASLYWNATGYGEDPDVDPDRFEHFGMTTVEAMASGCVPLSYAQAGQPEIIENDVSGVLWNTFDELASATLALTGDGERRARLTEAAIARSKDFTYDRFRVRLRRLVAEHSEALR
jgi:glycosyltransferase involved in cell wall biosynthesis